MPDTDIVVHHLDHRDPCQLLLEAAVLKQHIPNIRIFTKATEEGRQRDCIQHLKGYKRGTIQASLSDLFALLVKFARGGRNPLELFNDHKRAFRSSLDRRGSLTKWYIALSDVCDLLDHDGGLGCSTFLFEHFLKSFKILFPELQNLNMRDETVELFYSFMKVFRGFRFEYLDSLHAIWAVLDADMRSDLVQRMNMDRVAGRHEAAVERMLYAISNPRRPVNNGNFEM